MEKKTKILIIISLVIIGISVFSGIAVAIGLLNELNIAIALIIVGLIWIIYGIILLIIKLIKKFNCKKKKIVVQ